jgi:hypothetical protein
MMAKDKNELRVTLLQLYFIPSREIKLQLCGALIHWFMLHL